MEWFDADHIGAAPNEGYAVRILSAFREHCKIVVPRQGVADEIFSQCNAERLELLNKAIEKLEQT